MSLKYRQPLYAADKKIEFAYFIETGVGSPGDDRAPTSVYVQVPGAGLKKRSCECYQVSKSEFDRLLGN